MNTMSRIMQSWQFAFLIIFGGLCSGSLVSVNTASAAALTFSESIIDSATSGDVKAIGDINNDGFADLVMGGVEMNWYEYPSWTKHTVAIAQQEFTTDMQVVDVDGDGDLDMVTAEYINGSNVIWLENPLPTGNPATVTWTRHVIGSHGNWVHDIEVGDFDRDGKVDVVARKAGVSIFFQDTPTTWTKRDISSVVSGDEGIGIGDVDQDGDLDLVAAGTWIEAPANPRTGTWIARSISSGWGADTTGVVGDINGDTRPDVVFAGQHTRGKLAWYEGPTNPVSGTWTEHVVDSSMGSHKLNLGDINRDGRLDIVAGLELLELAVYVQASDTTFAKTTLSTIGTHNQRLADIRNDGDLDIFGANWIGNPPALLWENTTDWKLPLDQWTANEITNNHAQTFGLDFGDVDRDGRQDIVSGQYWYRNPGSGLSGAWAQSTALPTGMEVIRVMDVDGDSLTDVIAQKTEGSVLALYWLEATSTAATAWNSVRMGDVPVASHVLGSQGHHLVDVRAGGRPEVVVSSGGGLWYFEVPTNPVTDPWIKVRISSNPSDEGFGNADIDGDGDLDVAAGTGDTKLIEWYRNPGSGGADWPAFTIGNMNEAVYPDRFAVADLNGDNHPDIIGTEENGATTTAQTFWWEAPSNPTAPNWTRHTLVLQGSTNSLDVTDMDRDGDNDIVLGEHKGSLKVAVWENNGTGIFTEHVVGVGRESHLGTQAIDLDGDGDKDIVSIAYDAPQFISLWRNDALGGGTPDTTAPTLSAIGSTAITTTGATINWTTNEASDSQVEYGLTTAYDQTTTLNNTLVTSHTTLLTGLTASTLYHYRVKSRDAAGNLATSGDYTLTTSSSGSTPPAGLAAAYNFDAGSGSLATDLSENNNTGTLQNGTAWTVAGKYNGALQFDGIDDYVNLGHPASLSFMSSFTISAWVYPLGLSGDRDIITKVNAFSSDYHFQVTGTQLQVGFSTGGNWYYQNVPMQGMPLNAWSHVATVFDDVNNIFVIYINGAQQGSSQSVTASLMSSSSDVHIGMGWSGQSWNGRIDDVRMYNRALTGSEITTDMNTPVGGPIVDTTPPVRTGGSPTGTLPETTTSATVSLSTNENATCRYGTTPGTAYAALTSMTTTGSTSHSVQVTGLIAGGNYAYSVRCQDSVGNTNTDDYAVTFSVQAPDTTAPTVSITAPQNNAIVAGNITVSAQASDDRGVVRVEFLVDGSLHSTDTSSPYSAVVNTSILTEGTHVFSAKAFDAVGNSTDASVSVTVQNADTTAPSIPANLVATAVSTSAIGLAWSASTDNIGVTGYRVYRGGSLVATVSTLTYQDTGLAHSTSYSYRVAAIDAAGNASAQSSAVSATTLTPDTTAPTLSAIGSSAITATAATINWTTNEASDSQVEYGLTTSYGQTTTLNSTLVNSHTTLLAGLTANTLYHYRVKSRDAAGNLATSGDYSFTTSSETGLVGRWSFDEGTGTVAQDSSGNGRNGTLTNGPTWTTGRIGGAINFDGTNDYVDIPTIDISGSALTMATWVNFSALPTNTDQRFLSKASGMSESAHYWMLGQSYQNGQHRLRVRVRAGGSTKTLIASSGNLTTNTWYHATATYDGANIKLYLNGTLVGSTSKTGTLNTSASVGTDIGRNPDSSNYVRGKLDDVRIYNRALSASEISDLAAGN